MKWETGVVRNVSLPPALWQEQKPPHHWHSFKCQGQSGLKISFPGHFPESLKCERIWFHINLMPWKFQKMQFSLNHSNKFGGRFLSAQRSFLVLLSQAFLQGCLQELLATQGELSWAGNPSDSSISVLLTVYLYFELAGWVVVMLRQGQT